jgi:hypothetical protein
MPLPHPALLSLAAGSEASNLDDPSEVVRSAFEHHMFGLLWTDVRVRHVPLAHYLEDGLAVQDLLTQDRHARLWKTIGVVDDVLGSIGVEFAVIKGVPTEARWYSRLGERPCADVDVWLSPAAVPRAEEVVRTLDPGGSAPEGLLDRHRRGLVHTVDLEIEGTTVDLHLDPLKVGLVGHDTRPLWAHTVPYETPDGVVISVLDTEATLFHRLIEMNHDSFFRLLGFADVTRMMGAGPLDWDAFDALARSYGLDVVAWSGLRVVVETLELDLSIPRPRGVRAAVWRVMWRSSVRLQGDEGWRRFRHRYRWLPAFARGRLADAVRWWAAKLPETNPEERGPWPVRLAVGRWKRRRARARSEQSLPAGHGLQGRR